MFLYKIRLEAMWIRRNNPNIQSDLWKTTVLSYNSLNTTIHVLRDRLKLILEIQIIRINDHSSINNVLIRCEYGLTLTYSKHVIVPISHINNFSHRYIWPLKLLSYYIRYKINALLNFQC